MDSRTSTVARAFRRVTILHGLDQKTTRMAQEEKFTSKRRKALERELRIRMAPKARQAKGKARLNSYDAMLNQAA